MELTSAPLDLEVPYGNVNGYPQGPLVLFKMLNSELEQAYALAGAYLLVDSVAPVSDVGFAEAGYIPWNPHPKTRLEV